MATEQPIINVADNPVLRQLVEEVARTRQARVLRVDESEAEVVVRPTQRKRSPSKARPVTRDDALYRLVGIAASEQPANAAEHKHEALEEAYRKLHSS